MVRAAQQHHNRCMYVHLCAFVGGIKNNKKCTVPLLRLISYCVWGKRRYFENHNRNVNTICGKKNAEFFQCQSERGAK